MDAALAWPTAPAPTLPPGLDLAWPPTADDVKPFEDGVALGTLTIYSVMIPSSFPRVFVKSKLDLRALEAAWGTLARDHAGYAVWWNPALGIRARFDVPNPTPRIGRGLELAPYVSTIDRIANYEEMVLDTAAGRVTVPPGEWDPAPVIVTVDTTAVRRVQFTVRVDGPPVDEAAVIAKLDEIWGVHTVVGNAWTYAKGRVTVRRVETLPALELSFL